ncbi:ankyrin repeat domain-containing protein [candidate division KSB1 bacterium]
MKIYHRNNLRTLIMLTVLLLFVSFSSAQEIFKSAQEGDLAKIKELTADNSELVNAKDDDSNTPIFYAALGGHLDIIKFLIEKNAEADIKNKDAETPLHYAAYGGNNNVVLFFVQKGLDINAQTIYGYSPLHYAVLSGKKDAVKTVIVNGADINLKNGSGNTPLDLAIENKINDIVSFLKTKGAEETEIPDPVISQPYGNIQRISLLYAGKPNVSIYAGENGVLLIDTGYFRTLEKLKMLLKNMNKGEIKCIINTHLDYDHNGGNDIAGDEIWKINLGNLEQFASDGKITKSSESLQGRSGEKFDAFYTMRFNGEQIRLIPSPGIHKDSDILIHFTGSNVVVLGDLLLPESFPSINGKVVEDYLDFLAKVIDVFPEDAIFISGHGGDKTMQEIKEYRDMLSTSAEIVKAGMKAGKSADEMKKENILKKYESYNTFIPELNTDFWIDIVCQYYKDKK